MEVTSLLIVKHWNNYRTEADKHRFMTMLLANGIVWNCPACLALGFSVRESVLSLKNLESDLFPTEDSIVNFRRSALAQENNAARQSGAVDGTAEAFAALGFEGSSESSRPPVMRINY